MKYLKYFLLGSLAFLTIFSNAKCVVLAKSLCINGAAFAN